MTVDPDALAAELRELRRGLGARDPRLAKRIGPQLRSLCKIGVDDGPVAARRRMAEVVQQLLRDETKETRLAITAALALHPAADHRFLRDRQRWLAAQLRFHERTVRRRVDEAIEVLVRLAAESRPDHESPEAWQVQEIRAIFRLDGPSPELTEHRTLLFTADNVNEITTRFSLPRDPGAAGGSHDLVTEIVYGGRIRDQERPSPAHFRYSVDLPQTFHRGDTHEYGIRFGIPPGQPMSPHYALVPLLPVKSLDLTVRFPLSAPPSQIWRLDGVPPRMIDDPPPGDDALLRADRLGEIRVSFHDLRQGFGYGARWRLLHQ